MTLQFTSLEAKLAAQEVEAASPSRARPNIYRSGAKRALDLTLTILAVPIFVPVVFLLAILVMMDGHNPFYSQYRVGKNGRHFRMWKLRTMVPNADVLLEEYLDQNPEARREWDTRQKLKHDPRITWFGSILRKSSLDELPQLWNVINGTMSLVGPRPMMVSQRDTYTGEAYFKLTPGLTGLWQVSDRNACEFIGRVYYDEMYDRTLSLKTDVQVLFKTVSVVLRGTGY